MGLASDGEDTLVETEAGAPIYVVAPMRSARMETTLRNCER